MKHSKLILVLGFIFGVSAAFGQDYAFKVLANKGNNEVKEGDTWQAIKTGASLQSADEVRLAENAYLGLIHKSGKPLEVKKAGPYKVADLAAQVQGGGTSVLNKYTDFILSSNSAEAKKNRLSATGAVHRGAAGDIEILLPDGEYSSILNTQTVVNWVEDEKKAKDSGPYVVTLLNMFDEVLLRAETPEKTFKIDLTNEKLANESAILIEVHSKADPSIKSADPRPMIRKLPPAEQARLKKEVSEAKGELSEDTAIGMYYLGQIYEKNKLYLDAIAAYEQAAKMAPDVPDYKESYDDFLKFRLPRK